ncbi:MAG TPA: alanine--tRNA ligase-related protein, partial [Xylella sp.]
YEIDLFQTLILKATELTGVVDLHNKSLRVIADHIRACAFLIVDGVLPSNEGRGYVLRRIIRRALRHGWMLGVRQAFFSKMVPALVEVMGDAYPKLQAAAESVIRTLLVEEERFAETLDAGMKIFNDVAAKVTNGVILGSDVFRLYDTYGFPVDLTADIARERGMSVDMFCFETAMTQQRETARAAGKFGRGVQLPAERAAMLSPTVFLGYEQLQSDSLKVVALLLDGQLTDSASVGDEVIVLTDRTPFYAESGGQVGDIGTLTGFHRVRLEVTDTQKLMGQFHGHVARVMQGGVKVGDLLSASVDVATRKRVTLNHSATHLLHSALRSLFGAHVVQKGSLVASDRLRFDFSHFEPIGAAQIARIEQMVNEEVRANHQV